MRMHPREFPSGRRRKPKRQAERRVYEALAGNDRQGFCYYEWRKDYECIELDFAVWIEGLGRFALQVKGGRYQLSDGDWHLKTRDGVKAIGSCPLDEAWLAALDLHDDIEERAVTTYSPFVIPVLMFPDMELDPAIEALARRKGVYLVWWTDDLVKDLIAIVQRRSRSATLTMKRIALEVAAVTDGLIQLDTAREDEARGETSAPIRLSITMGGRNVLEVSAGNINLRFGTFIGPGASRKRRESGRP